MTQPAAVRSRLTRHAIVLTVLAAALLGLGAVVARVAFTTDAAAPSLVNEAGYQRFLSKEIMYLAERARHGVADGAETARMLSLADRLVADTAHLAGLTGDDIRLRALYQGDAAREVGGAAPGLLGQVSGFRDLVRRLAAPGAQRAAIVDEIDARYDALFVNLDAAALGFERLVSAGRSRHTLLLLGLFAGMLALVLAQAFFAWRAASGNARRAVAAAHAERDEIASLRDLAIHAATHDAMTRVTNRRGMLDALKAREEPSTVFMVDLDGFKHINDTLGHDIGDLLLLTIATRLREACHADDLVARVGGDEFVVAPAPDPDLDVAAFAANLVQLATAPVSYTQGGRKRLARLSVNVGVAACAGGKASAYDALKNAEMAVRRSKEKGRDGFTIFNPEFDTRSAMLRDLSEELLEGLEAGAIIPYYQPQVCARTHRVIGVEALARWRRRDGRIDAPFVFLDLAESLGVTAQIDHAILAAAVRDFETWRAAGVEIARVSVNVSLRRLEDRHLTDTLAGMTLPKGALAFELLESAYLDQQNETVKWNLDYIRERGIDLEVDDFGTGHASIVGVMSLEPARLKIARELVAPVVESEAKRAMIAAIVEIAHSMGVGLIAEGVETMEHAEILRDLGCETLQGYGFSRPIPAAEIPAFVARSLPTGGATRTGA